MSILCFLGKHDYQPAKTFSQEITRTQHATGKSWNDTIVVWHGYKCARCKRKKIEKDVDSDRNWQGATEKAYAWVQNKSPENPTMLKVVQK